MTDDSFAALLEKSRSELQQKPSVFKGRIDGGARWFYDLATCTLKIDEDQFWITPIGTFSHKHQTWMWAWANEDFPYLARKKAKHIQGLFNETEFRIFLEEGTNASADDANDFVALSVHHLGSIGFYRVPSTAPELPTLFLAIDKSTG